MPGSLQPPGDAQPPAITGELCKFREWNDMGSDYKLIKPEDIHGERAMSKDECLYLPKSGQEVSPVWAWVM